MKILFCAILFLFFQYSFTSKVNLMFEKYEIVPDLLDQAPYEVLQVNYKQKQVDLGNELTPTEVKDQPTVLFNADPNSYYTLLMVDPDAPSRTEPTFREVKHWFVGNIKGNDISNGEHITEYVGSGPPKGTGLHRYIFLLYKQKGTINFENEPKTASLSREHRLKFSTREFTAKYNLGHPVAGNFYEAQWNSYVEERNRKIAEATEKGQN